MLNESSDVRASRNYSNRGKLSNGSVIVVEKTGDKWASVRVDSMKKFNNSPPKGPKINEYVTTQSIDDGINLHIVEPGDDPNPYQNQPKDLIKNALAELDDGSQDESVEFINIKKKNKRRSPINQSQ